MTDCVFAGPDIPLVQDGRLGDRLVARDDNDWAPRVGIAWSPNPRWSFRTGAGIRARDRAQSDAIARRRARGVLLGPGGRGEHGSLYSGHRRHGKEEADREFRLRPLSGLVSGRTPSIIREPITGRLDLAYGRERDDTDIAASSLVDGRVAPVSVQASNRQETAPSISADGRRLAFLSQRSGTPEIWVSNSDGSQTRRLTHFDSGAAGTPQWSPDARRITFDATLEGNRDIYVIGSDGAELLRLTTDSAADGQPSWSHDGKRIYFMSDRSGSRQVWKMSSTGQHQTQLTHEGGYQAFESPDGKTLYYAKRQWNHGVWKVPVDGGREEPVVDAAWHNLWGVAADGIYYFDLGGLSPAAFEFPRLCTLKKFEFATGKIVSVAAMRTKLPTLEPSFAIRSDGGWLAWVSQPNRTSELLLIRDLRLGPS